LDRYRQRLPLSALWDLAMKAVVIGHGVMGKAHARTLRRLGHEVVTIDPDLNARADWLEAAPLPSADVACIATPPAFLASQASAALRAGMDVMVEKPMARDIERAQLLIEAEAETTRKVRVAYVERWNPAAAKLRESLPLIGTLRHVTIQRLGLKPRCPETGPALDLMTHDIDVLRYLGLWPRLEHSVVDGPHVCAHFALRSGHATVEASHLHPTKQRTLTAVGDDGMLSLDYQRQTLVLHTTDGARELEVERDEPLMRQWRGFLAGGGVTTGEALATLDLALRAEAEHHPTTQPEQELIHHD
jgi:predicted dehydrogenase